MEFDLAEKLAIVKMVESVIRADGIVHQKEINALSLLMDRLDFDSNFLVKTRGIENVQGMAIVNKMTFVKKRKLASILEEMAIADGFVHEKELKIIIEACKEMGIPTN